MRWKIKYVLNGTALSLHTCRSSLDATSLYSSGFTTSVGMKALQATRKHGRHDNM
jgi:hypothetical protein